MEQPYVLRIGAIYRVNVPGTDIVFVCVWTGRVRPNAELGCEDFEFFANGSTFSIPAPLLQDLTLVGTADSANAN